MQLLQSTLREATHSQMAFSNVQSRSIVSYDDRVISHVLKFSVTDKQGISKRFLNYFKQFDTTVGARALGPDQTLSGKVQATFSNAATQAKTMDAQKGYSKTAHEVSSFALTHPVIPGRLRERKIS